MTMYPIQSLRFSQVRIKSDCGKPSRIKKMASSDSTIDWSESERSAGDTTIDSNEDISFQSEPESILPRSPLKSCMSSKSMIDSSLSISSKSSVRFDKVETREYELVLSDNPCISSGPAIGLGWDSTSTHESDIDSYEAERHYAAISGSGSQNARKNDLRISPGERVAMLLGAGYSPHEVQESLRQRNEARERRNSSLKYQKYDPIIEKMQKLKKTVKRFKPSRRQYLQ